MTKRKRGDDDDDDVDQLLMEAVCVGNHFGVQALVEGGRANGNATGADGWTALEHACYEGYAMIAKVLIENGTIDLNAKCRDGRTTLYEWTLRWAFEEDHEEVAKLLIENGGDAEKIHVIGLGENNNKNGNTLLQVWLFGACLEVAKSLIKIGADIHAKNKKGRTPLREACRHGKLEVVKWLIVNGTNVHSEGESNGWKSFYCFACEESHSEGKDDGWTLCWACDGGHLEIVKLLMEKDGNYFNAKYDNGETPLHWTIGNCSRKIGNFLIENGTDLNAVDNQGKTPLHWVCENRRRLDLDQLLQIATLLIEKGADLNSKDNHGMTPLHLAWMKQQLEVAKLLIENGADLNTKDNDGKTPLHLACAVKLLSQGYSLNYLSRFDTVGKLLEAFKLLIENGAHLNLKDNDGNTPLHVACDNRGYWDMAQLLDSVKLLVENGADLNPKKW